jgi:hypothetical protein
MEVSSQLHAPAALLSAKEPLVPSNRRLGRTQSRSVSGGEEVFQKLPAPIPTEVKVSPLRNFLWFLQSPLYA